jgi:RNA polymerase sigma-70 factor (ECF subfamily)
MAEDRDASLVAAVARGDERAFELLYDRYSAVVYGLGVRMLGSPQAAEDLTQEVFLALWRRAAAYVPGRGSVRTWLLAMTHHVGVDAIRARASAARRVEALASMMGTEGEEGIPERLVARDEAARLHAAMATLPGEQRRVLEMAYLEERSQSEIADRTGAPLGTVKGRVRLGLARLANCLGTEVAPA